MAINAVRDICEDGIYDGDANNYNAQNFDATSNTDLVATANTDVSACRNHFLGLANSFSRSLTGVTVDSTSLSSSTTSESRLPHVMGVLPFLLLWLWLLLSQ